MKNKKITIYSPQPRAFIPLFFIEMWERFGFYGMQFILIFFMTEKLGIVNYLALEQQGAFISLVYISPMVGGWLADRILGIKHTLLTGAFFLAFGYLLLALSAQFLANVGHTNETLILFYSSLGLIIVGNGCFKPNPTSLLSKAYGDNDPRMDKGYTLFYLSINIGSMVAIIFIPFIALYYGYPTAFGLCSLGLFIGISNFLRKWSLFDNLGSDPDFDPLHYAIKAGIIISLLLLTLIFGGLVYYVSIANYLFNATVIIVAALLLFLSFTVDDESATKMRACLILIAISVIFWIIYNSLFGVVNLFVKYHVDRHLFGYEIPAPSFAIFDPLSILILGPLMNKLYEKLHAKNINFTIPWKFAFGMIAAALSMFVFTLMKFVQVDSVVSMQYIVPIYVLVGIAELLVAAIGLSMIAKLAPEKYLGLMYGALLLAVAVGGWLSGQLGKVLKIPTEHNAALLATSFNDYIVVFTKLGILTLFAALLAMLIAPYVSRQTGELDSDRHDPHNVVEDSI